VFYSAMCRKPHTQTTAVVANLATKTVPSHPKPNRRTKPVTPVRASTLDTAPSRARVVHRTAPSLFTDQENSLETESLAQATASVSAFPVRSSIALPRPYVSTFPYAAEGATASLASISDGAIDPPSLPQSTTASQAVVSSSSSSSSSTHSFLQRITSFVAPPPPPLPDAEIIESPKAEDRSESAAAPSATQSTVNSTDALTDMIASLSAQVAAAQAAAQAMHALQRGTTIPTSTATASIPSNVSRVPVQERDDPIVAVTDARVSADSLLATLTAAIPSAAAAAVDVAPVATPTVSKAFDLTMVPTPPLFVPAAANARTVLLAGGAIGPMPASVAPTTLVPAPASAFTSAMSVVATNAAASVTAPAMEARQSLAALSASTESETKLLEPVLTSSAALVAFHRSAFAQKQAQTQTAQLPTSQDAAAPSGPQMSLIVDGYALHHAKEVDHDTEAKDARSFLTLPPPPPEIAAFVLQPTRFPDITPTGTNGDATARNALQTESAVPFMSLAVRTAATALSQDPAKAEKAILFYESSLRQLAYVLMKDTFTHSFVRSLCNLVPRGICTV
jgi:hypothetical protein